MAQIEEVDISVPDSRRLRFDWLLATLIRPGKTMPGVAAEDKAQWLLPLLLLTILTLVFVFVAGPLRQQAMLSATTELPEGFEYMTPEQQEQFMQAQQSTAGPAQIYVFPGVAALAGVWISWFVLGSILHLALTLLGSRSSAFTAYNLASWASLPFAIRLIVQIVAMLATQRLIQGPGFSGYIAADATGMLSYLRSLLSHVDIYLIWQLVLIVLGASSIAGLTRGKAFSGVLISMLLLLALAALPGFLMTQLSGLSVDRPFIFF